MMLWKLLKDTFVWYQNTPERSIHKLYDFWNKDIRPSQDWSIHIDHDGEILINNDDYNKGFRFYPTWGGIHGESSNVEMIIPHEDILDYALISDIFERNNINLSIEPDDWSEDDILMLQMIL